MKQIDKTPKIQAALQKAVGTGVSTDDLVVYEAIALNTLPLRKNSPLYKNAITERGILLQMADRINAESLPVQIMHDDAPLPIGRVFSGQVQNTGTGSELRVLFYVSKTEPDIIKKIDNGTVDQVSVSILPKQILCSDCGFDFLGADASFEHLYTGTDPKGHQLGKDGVHANLVGLDNFFEMSLVGRGGAQNARIVSRDKSSFGSSLQHLAASGADLNKYVLSATMETKLMDMEALIVQLTDAKAAKTVADGEVASLKAAAKIDSDKIAALNTQLTEAGTATASLAAKDATIVAQKAELDLAVAEIKDIAKGVLIASGDVNPTLPEKVGELVEIIKTKGAKMKAFLTAGGSRGADALDKKELPSTPSAFRTAAR